MKYLLDTDICIYLIKQKPDKALSHFIDSIQYILPMDKLAASYGAKIRADLKRKGAPIGPYDLLIAAIAVANKLTLVTNNVREFQRVAGVKFAIKA